MEEFYFTENFAGYNLFYAPVCNSTNDVAQICAGIYGLKTPLAVYSFDQRKGRGQGNNLWESEPGKNLAITFLQDDSLATKTSPVAFNKCIALGVRDTLQKLTGLAVKIKWPNDMYHDGYKLSGLLMESLLLAGELKVLSVGIGINVNQVVFKGNFKASSLHLATGEYYELINVVHELTYQISSYTNKLRLYNSQVINELYHEHLYQVNQQIVLDLAEGTQVTGTLSNIDDSGRIVLIDRDGKKMAFHHGEARIAKEKR